MGGFTLIKNINLNTKIKQQKCFQMRIARRETQILAVGLKVAEFAFLTQVLVANPFSGHDVGAMIILKEFQLLKPRFAASSPKLTRFLPYALAACGPPYMSSRPGPSENACVVTIVCGT